MCGGKKARGYTIIEVMIVLAISGFMFVIAANFISGKQAKTAFYTGVNEFSDQINAVINQVRTGQYSDANFSCTNSGSGISIAASASSTQGTNGNCTFIGKYIKISDGSSSYKIHSIAGQRQDSVNLDNSAFLLNLKSTPITVSGGVDLTISKNIPQNLVAAGGADFGFLQNSDSSNLILVNTNSDLAAATQPTFSELPKSVICLTDGSRYASVIVGAENNSINSTVKYQDNINNCKAGN